MITDINYTKRYYGSTCEKLCNRFAHHTYAFRNKEKVRNPCSSSMIFDEFGVENCKIELVELYPCHSIEELQQREGNYIKNNECVNKITPGRTNEQKKQIKQEYDDKYYQVNSCKKIEYQKIYNANNQDKIKNKKNASCHCDCGGDFTYSNKNKHLKTNHHRSYIVSLLTNFKRPEEIVLIEHDFKL